uniref:NADH:ubiquinone reductase (H(+)-translocating) n=1 Tax=Paragonimus westermani complex sp. type 1 TaxID=1586379 RepID=A0A0K0LG93_9TREM|nr:NADH dehydrogenase subunit 5 [Paragonimus westermani complex sp. type 1]AJA32738.1 NADH dehydrogenase subunit 5 [Paragonimus westermani complex sp. type 1]
MLGLGVVTILGSFVVWGSSSSGWEVFLNFWGYGWKEGTEVLVLDEVSLICLFMLLCCGSIALPYCCHYFTGLVEESVRLFSLMIWFLMVMGVLVLSGSLVLSLVMWEYLGLVSFLLILFYSNMDSARAALVTLFASRFGDVSLFMLILWCGVWLSDLGGFFFFFFLLVILTKSAGYPFISWLLEAMRAPTPVSSLVHSSTLVAAGVWFVVRYQEFLVPVVQSFLFLFCILTVVVSGTCASFFSDLKKVVALSTCNNISWCVIFFVCGDWGLCLLQLLTHGVCSWSMLVSVGDLMSHSGGSQSSVGVYSPRYVGSFGVVLQSVLIFSLSGLPFMGVFFSKHGLFSSVSYCYGIGFLCAFWVAFFLTYVYSVRLSLLLLKSSSGLVSGYSSNFLLIGGLCLLGTFLNWLGLVLFDESFELNGWWSGVMLLVQFLGCLGGWFLWSGAVSLSGDVVVWSSLLWGSDCLVSVVYGWFLGLSEASVLSFYRWELYGLSLVRVGRDVLVGVFTSLNFLVLGLIFVILFVSLVFS